MCLWLGTAYKYYVYQNQMHDVSKKFYSKIVLLSAIWYKAKIDVLLINIQLSWTLYMRDFKNS